MIKKNIVLTLIFLFLFLPIVFFSSLYFLQKANSPDIKSQIEETEKSVFSEEVPLVSFSEYLSKISRSNGVVPQEGWMNFCQDNYDLGEKSISLIDSFSEREGIKDYYHRDMEVYQLISDIFNNKDISCDDDKDVCEKIVSLKNLDDYLLRSSNNYCENLKEEDKNLCILLDEIILTKQLNISQEFVKNVCSVDEGFVGELIQYFDEQGVKNQCISDGGQILNIALASVKNDLSYCKNIIAPEHQAHKAFCIMAASDGDINLAKMYYTDDFCKHFSEDINRQNGSN